MLIDELKAANIKAMKERDNNSRAVLSIVLTRYKLQEVELRSQGKEIGDTEMIQLIQKSIKELDEEKELYAKAGRAESVKEIEVGQEALKVYLPKMMSKDEIKAEIEKLVDKSIGSVMKHFKVNFAGKCDMRDVQEVLKSL